MTEHIAYAMRNTEAVNSLIFFNAPAALKDWSFLAIEWIVFTGFALAVLHAIRHARNSGTPSAIYTLLGCFLYGLLIDITSYYTVNNFWHGEFSVMFLHNRLPLYIALFYPAFMYHAYMTIHRFDFKPLTEAVCVGFFGGLVYLIFDNLGPLLGWWIWDRASPTTQPYLDSVPMTSYHWFFLFTGAFALFARIFFWDFVAAKKSTAKIIAGLLSTPVLTCIAGGIVFVPYNVIAAKMSYGAAAFFHAVTFSLAGLLFLFSFHTPQQPRDKLLMLFPILWIVGHLYIYIAKWQLFLGLTPQGVSAEGLQAGNLIAAVVAMIAGMAIVLLSHPLERK